MVINGVNIRDLSQQLMFQLKLDILAALDACSPKELLQLYESHLWVIYLGAYHETRNKDVRGWWQEMQALEQKSVDLDFIAANN
jgi:hypothetical protein